NLRHRHRDALDPDRPLRRPQGPGRRPRHPGPPVRPRRLLPAARVHRPPPESPPPRRFFATTGLSVTRDGESRPEDLTLAARNALLNMIDHLQDHGGWTRQQAYAICSVAVDLKVSEVVDVPSFVVSAFLPLDIFEG